MDTLKIVEINNVRSIKEISISLPVEKGLYAITGKNGSGKSTLMATIANLFFYNIFDSFFINSAELNSEIKYSYNNISQSFTFNNKKWSFHGRKIYLHGFLTNVKFV